VAWCSRFRNTDVHVGGEDDTIVFLSGRHHPAPFFVVSVVLRRRFHRRASPRAIRASAHSGFAFPGHEYHTLRGTWSGTGPGIVQMSGLDVGGQSEQDHHQ
jgi:hypothetical protein